MGYIVFLKNGVEHHTKTKTINEHPPGGSLYKIWQVRISIGVLDITTSQPLDKRRYLPGGINSSVLPVHSARRARVSALSVVISKVSSFQVPDLPSLTGKSEKQLFIEATKIPVVLLR